MRKALYILILCAVAGMSSSPLSAQLSDFGTAGSISLSKSINRSINMSVEQELRFDQMSSSLSRSATSIEADFTLVRRLLRAEFDYNLLYRRNNDFYYEFRHRASVGLRLQQKQGRLSYRLRTRMQSTYRDENRGDHKFNPRYVWRNKLEFRYDIFGSAFTPYMFGEIFCPVNSVHGFYMDGYRISLGTKYKVSKRSDLDFRLFFDQDIQQAYPRNMLYSSVGWSYSL